ncbi:MAG TPA: hypothetical protein V6C90_25745 [Coleofasciculaceae cyanobacterium]
MNSHSVDVVLLARPTFSPKIGALEKSTGYRVIHQWGRIRPQHK